MVRTRRMYVEPVSMSKFMASRINPLKGLTQTNAVVGRILSSKNTTQQKCFALRIVIKRLTAVEKPPQNVINQIQGTIRELIGESGFAIQKKLRTVSPKVLEGKKRPAKLKNLEPETRKALDVVNFQARGSNIRKRFEAFSNLSEATQESECKPVVNWLSSKATAFERALRKEESIEMYANYADLALRCYGTAVNLCSKGKLKTELVKLHKRLRLLHETLGLT